jgi:hypothetical protein
MRKGFSASFFQRTLRKSWLKDIVLSREPFYKKREVASIDRVVKYCDGVKATDRNRSFKAELVQRHFAQRIWGDEIWDVIELDTEPRG